MGLINAKDFQTLNHSKAVLSIHQLVDLSELLDVLSGVLGCPVYPRRMITKDVLGRFRIFEAEHIISKKLVNEDSRFKYYESQVLMNGTYTNVLLKGSRRMSPAEWREQMYDELRVSFVARELHLPMRTVHGILRADNGYVIYDNKPGCEFSRFLEEYDDKLDLGTRIKLCRALASVMSGLYNADIYCGAVKLDNFYAYYVGALPYSRIQLVFTGGADLTPLEKTKPIDSGDFSQMAPEVSWTRLLTPEAGVHSMGLVLRRVLGHLPELPTQDPNASLLPRINALISKCLHPRPSERPSMNGIFLELDNAAGSVRHTRQPRWTPI
ncbi:unnamed protein product [Haemonchus placei]|uniref:Protein kinase domain-containing protein n=1 Tax=Haemonchus placei TaxID=6290 RepID=A0A0N4W713_HAEPC|nr:unnamed protein product [Haemonchus placei]